MDELVLKDLSAELGEPSVRELLLQLEYASEVREEKTDRIISDYRAHPEWPILGVELQGELIGLVGLALGPGASAVIRHIAVRRDQRRRGIGRAIIAAVCRKYRLRQLSAETDGDAVGFYRQCGFRVRSLGETYPGTERFFCILDDPACPKAPG